MIQVPYEKGFYFLYYLQSLVGRERFDAFLKAYIENHAYSSIFSEVSVKLISFWCVCMPHYLLVFFNRICERFSTNILKTMNL